jgi:hypothetical protein
MGCLPVMLVVLLLPSSKRLPKIEIDWLIKVLGNECFHNGPVICFIIPNNRLRIGHLNKYMYLSKMCV